MAVLKIYQVQNKVRPPEVPQTGSLTLPLSLATNLGKGIGSIGQIIEDVAQTNRQEEEANETTEIISKLNPKIAEIYNKYSTGTKVQDGVLAFNNDLSNIEFDASSKNVKRKVDKYLRDQTLDLGLNLSKKIINNSVETSKLNKDKELNSYIFDMTSDSALRRSTGTRNYNTFFSNPSNQTFYGPAAFEKLKEEKDSLYVANVLIKGIDNGNVDVTDPNVVKEIKEQFGDLGAERFLKYGRTKTISNILNQEEAEIKKQKFDTETQLNNFATVINEINLAIDDPTKNKPSLDQIYDVYNQNGLNTVQYNALLKFYHNPNKQSDLDIADLINSQIAIAQSANELDQIISDLNSNKSILEGMNPKDVVMYKGIIEKYKNDKLGKSNYDKFKEQIKLSIKDVNSLSFINDSSKVAETKIKSNNAIESYNSYIVNERLSPEEAYLKVITNISEKDLPELTDLPQPIGFKLVDVQQLINKNPEEGFNDLYKKAIEKFSKDKNISDYKTNIRNLDLIKDVYQVRKRFENVSNFKVLGKLSISKKSMNEG